MANQERQYTAEEVIDITINLLGQIGVPASLARQISLPIADSIQNLQVCKELMRQEKQEWEKEKVAMQSVAEPIEDEQEEAQEGEEDGREADAE